MCAKRADGLMWQNKPDRSALSKRYEIIRCPAKPKGVLKLTCFSHEVVGIMTWYNGATKKPCVIGSLLEQNAERRWYGYVWCKVEGSEVLSILEITALAGEQFAEYFERRRTLRGSYWKLSRSNGKPNGPVRAEFRAPETDTKPLPGMPDLVKILKTIWGFRDEAQLDSPPVIRDEIARALVETNGKH